MTRCGHGRVYTKPCRECEEIWRAECVATVRKQAAALGFALVPLAAAVEAAARAPGVERVVTYRKAVKEEKDDAE